ncbi:MAG: MotA/TolQ/ExbB proton channel family protein [Planctomycetes bacterium]|nr:MotA/TolQ/ExbB proton channel family protein [Planctomycetota bacterium]
MVTVLLAQAATNAAPASKNLLSYVSDGGFLSYVLIGLSVVALTLAIRNAIMFRADKFAPDGLLREIALLADKNDLAGLASACGRTDTFAGRVLLSALRRCEASPFAMLEFRAGVEESGTREMERTHRLNDGLAIIAAVAPMLGLLGTVIGMIGAFSAISALQGVARSNELARFMSMALVNTAEGLIIAIPATIVFGIYRRRIDSLADDAMEALDPIASQLQRTAPATGGPKPAQHARPAPAMSPPRAAAGA